MNRVLLFIFCVSANAIHSFTMHPVYGGNSFTRPAIHVWCRGSLLMVEKVLLTRNDQRPASSQHGFLHQALTIRWTDA